MVVFQGVGSAFFVVEFGGSGSGFVTVSWSSCRSGDEGGEVMVASPSVWAFGSLCGFVAWTLLVAGGD